MINKESKLKLEKATADYNSALKYVSSLDKGIIRVFTLMQFIINFAQQNLIDDKGDLIPIKWYSFVFNSQLREFTIKVIRETLSIINSNEPTI